MDQPQTHEGGENSARPTQRAEGFSDAVIAIAITLSAVELRVPEEGETLAMVLTDRWTSYLAFILSVSAIGTYWLNQHFLYNMIARTDHWTNLWNLLFLGEIALVPFVSSVLTHGLIGDYSEAPTAIHV